MADRKYDKRPILDMHLAEAMDKLAQNESINPLRWPPEYNVAWGTIAVLGALVGTFYAWLDSADRLESSHSISGDWSNGARVFMMFLSYPNLYWPFSLYAAVVFGLLFYIWRLIKI